MSRKLIHNISQSNSFRFWQGNRVVSTNPHTHSWTARFPSIATCHVRILLGLSCFERRLMRVLCKKLSII